MQFNPVRAGLIDPRGGQSVLDYPWCSVAGGHALLPRSRPLWLATEQVLAAFGCAATAAGRQRWVEHLDARVVAEGQDQCGVPVDGAGHDGRRSNLRRGWHWGSQAFAERILKLGSETLRKPRHRSAKASLEKRAHGEQEALRLLAEGLAAAGLTATELVQLPGSEARKVAIAQVIWEQTTVDMPWLARHRQMRSAANASQQIRRFRHHPPKLAYGLKKWITQSRNVA